MRIEDNKLYLKNDFISNYPKLSEKILDYNIKELFKEQNILIYPSDFSLVKDIDEQSKIVESLNNKVKTGNLVGFIGVGEEQLEIHSRFSKDNNYHFLAYMLEKVLHMNLIDFSLNLSVEERMYQLLLYIFPSYLNESMRKGVYKKYRKVQYNDGNIKGSIDIARHIKQNTPFTGKVSYSTREFSEDNDLMQLIRHTIEYLKTSNQGQRVLNSLELTKQNVRAIINATPSYNLGKRQKLIAINNSKRVNHAYYTEYRMLQKLCIMILSKQRHGLKGENTPIHGILFDVAWLWEEYLHTLLKDAYIHPQNKKKQDGLSLFSERTRTVYPDFYSKDKKIVLDAKYKKLEVSAKGIAREDLYQIISYAYILKAEYAGVLYPSMEEIKMSKIGELAGYGATIFKQPLQIPQGIEKYSDFVREMKMSEDRFTSGMTQYVKNIESKNIVEGVRND